MIIPAVTPPFEAIMWRAKDLDKQTKTECRYCSDKGANLIISPGSKYTIRLVGQTLQMLDNHTKVGAAKISYCPVCGRKL